MMRTSALLSGSLLLAFLAACPTVPGEDDGPDPDTGIDLPTTTGPSTDTEEPPDPSEGSTEGGSSTGDPDPDTSSSGESGSPGESGGGALPLDCSGTTYSCTNGIDDDGDGLIDLFDPECTGPCDDDESSFQTGIPGDNMDCKQDCFFDGNSGQGNDGCNWDLRCDPADPGAQIGCGYTGNNNCSNQEPPDVQCQTACEPYVPPGCDCFGCCTVQTDAGAVSIFLNSSSDCALDDLDACEQCTPQNELCGNPCNPEDCELCFGQTELPEGCEENSCDFGTPCGDHEDCLDGDFCYLGCCYPPPVG